MAKKKFKSNLKEEQKLWKQGCEFVVGLDEVGRGPLAGPVIAGAVCIAPAKIKNQKSKFNPPTPLSKGGAGGLRDSKQLSAKQREKWFEILTNHPHIHYGLGIVPPKIIDKINILQATKMAMRLALKDLEKKFLTPRPCLSAGRPPFRKGGRNQPPFLLGKEGQNRQSPLKKGERGVKNEVWQPDFLLIDGNFLLDNISVNQKAVIRGDEKIISCAAASIIAKVTRDRLMIECHKKYSRYGFDKHKGYGSKAHRDAIKKHGPCAIHRLSFGPCRGFIRQ